MTIDLTSDIIDTRDIIERIEELEASIEDGAAETPEQERAEAEELNTLLTVMEELKDNGDDEQWRGDWYPLTLIRDSYFRDYAEELAVDCGMVNSQASWPNNCIDWDQAARELKYDYTSISVDGVTYYFR